MRKGLAVAAIACFLDAVYLGVFFGWTHSVQDQGFVSASLVVVAGLALVIVSALGYEVWCLVKADTARRATGVVYHGRIVGDILSQTDAHDPDERTAPIAAGTRSHRAGQVNPDRYLGFVEGLTARDRREDDGSSGWQQPSGEHPSYHGAT